MPTPDPNDPRTWPGAIVAEPSGEARAKAGPGASEQEIREGRERAAKPPAPTPPVTLPFGFGYDEPAATLPQDPDPNDPRNWPGAISGGGPQSPPRSVGDYLRQGVTDTAYSLLGPFMAINDLGNLPRNAAASLLGADWLRAQPSADTLKRGLEATGLPGDPGTSWGSKVIQNVGGMLPFMGAGRAIQAATGAARAASPMLARIGEALTAQPASQVAAGVGAGTAQAVAPEHPIAQLAAGLIGGVGTGGLTNAVRKAITWAGTASEPGMTEGLNLLAKNAADRIALVNRALGYHPDPESVPLPPGQAGPPAPDTVGQMRNLRTTGEVFEDPGVMITGKALREDRGALPAVQRDNARREARGSVLDSIVPSTAADPAALRAPFEQQAADAEAALAAARGTGGLGPPAPGEQTGPALLDQFTALRNAARVRVNALANAVDPFGEQGATPDPARETTLPTDSVRAAAQNSAERNFPNTPPDQRPPEVRAKLQALSSDTLTYEQMRALAAQAGYEAQTAAPDLQRTLRDIRDVTEQQIRNGLPPDMAARHAAYIQAATEEGNRYAGPIAKALEARDYARSGYATPSTIAGEYFKPDESGGADTMDAFRRYYTDPATGQIVPEAADAMRQHLASQVLGFTHPGTGETNAAALAQWVADHRGALSAVPELGLYDRVRNVEQATRLAGEAGARGISGVPDVPTYNDNIARTLLGAESMPKAVRAILANPNQGAAMQDALARIGNNEAARESLRRHVLNDFAESQVTGSPNVFGQRQLSQTGGSGWWRNNQRALGALFSPDELQRLQAFRDDLWSQQAAASRTSTLNSETAGQISNGKRLAGEVLGEGPIGVEIAERAGKAVPVAGDIGSGIWRIMRGRALGDAYRLSLDPELFAAMMRRQGQQGLREIAGVAERKPQLLRAGSALMRTLFQEGAQPAFAPLLGETMRRP